MSDGMKSVKGVRGGGPGGVQAAAGADVLTSRENRWLKEFRVALRGGVPTASGAVGVEGVRLVEEALTSGCRVEAVLFSETGERHRERLAPLVGKREMGFPVLRTTDRLFEGIADTEHPQGVAALVEPRRIELPDVLATPHGVCAPLLVVLAGVQDPGKRGNNSEDSGSVWSDWGHHCRNRTEWDGEPVCAESDTGFGGSGAASADFEWDGVGNFADAIEAERDSDGSVLCA